MVCNFDSCFIIVDTLQINTKVFEDFRILVQSYFLWFEF